MIGIKQNFIFILTGLILFSACSGGVKTPATEESEEKQDVTEMQSKLNMYVPFELTADITHLSGDEK